MNKSITLIAVTCFLMNSCSSTRVESSNIQASQSQPEQQKLVDPAAMAPSEHSPLRDPNNILFRRSAYFDMNKAVVKKADHAFIAAHAKYLISHPGISITIQGNCDERGGEKYNQALGLKRAMAMKQLMMEAGVPEKQIATISFGKDKPDVVGHGEKSWAENRRADIVYADEHRIARALSKTIYSESPPYVK